MALTINPSSNDIGPVAGHGKNVLEIRFATILGTIIGDNVIVSGFALPASDPDLNLSVPAGIAILDGRVVEYDAAESLAMTANSTNHIFIKLTKDGSGNANGAPFEVNTSGTAPTDSVKIGQAITNSSAVTSTVDERRFTPITTSVITDAHVTPLKLKTAIGFATVTSPASAQGSNSVNVDVPDYQLGRHASFVRNGSSGNLPGSGSGGRGDRGPMTDPGDVVMRTTVSATSSATSTTQQYGPPIITHTSTTTAWLRYRYMTASDSPSLWMVFDKETGFVIGAWYQDDPPPLSTPPISPGEGTEGIVKEVKLEDIERLSFRAECIKKADEHIRCRGLKMKNLAYRAMEQEGAASGIGMPCWLSQELRLDGGRVRQVSAADNHERFEREEAERRKVPEHIPIPDGMFPKSDEGNENG